MSEQATTDAANAARGAPPLDYGVIGNGRVLALISPTSSIDWLCLPRFDSPSVFGRLLDRDNGGSFRVLCGGKEIAGKLAYIINTNVVRTVFEVGEVAWEVIDFAPRIPDGLVVHTPLAIVRVLRPLRGTPVLSVDFDPRPDYGRAKAQTVEAAAGLIVRGNGEPLFLESNVPAGYILHKREFVLDRPRFFSLNYGQRPGGPTIASIERDLHVTISGWQAWVRGCALPSFAADRVLRAALCLKMHVSEDTGAVIAAATTSIPEAMGTERTWDYRYCWMRDAAFTVEALRRIGQLTEGEWFGHFLRDVAESAPLQPVYSISGDRQLEEVMIPELAGFGGNGHVRIGNAAAKQQQNDLMGEVILILGTLMTDPRLVKEDPRSFWPLVDRLVEDAIVAAPEPDMGIWEFRTKLKCHTFSRAMCWVAISRGAELARRFGITDKLERWERIAAEERDIVLRRGFNAELGFFTQELDGDQPDASLLLLPTLGLIDARDPRFGSTVDAYGKLLMDRGLILRYINQDDFGETTSAFTICSFWYAEALALMGRLDDAIAMFEHICSFANPVGLFSEDVDPETGTLLGNFPQAYTHVGLINAAMTIGERLDARSGRAGAWR